MSNRKCVKTREGNKDNKHKGPDKNSMGPRNLGPGDDRIKLHIPKKSKIYEFLYGDNTIINIPIWRQLDMILDAANHNKDVEVIRIYDEFVKSISVFYPDKVADLNKLRPLIIKHILKGDSLDESYYKEIREL